MLDDGLAGAKSRELVLNLRVRQAFVWCGPVGIALFGVGLWLLAPWAAVISSQIRRLTGPESPLPGLRLGVGMMVCLMQAATFRADRDPAIVLAISVLAWLPCIGLFAMAVPLLAAVRRQAQEVP